MGFTNCPTIMTAEEMPEIAGHDQHIAFCRKREDGLVLCQIRIVAGKQARGCSLGNRDKNVGLVPTLHDSHEAEEQRCDLSQKRTICFICRRVPAKKKTSSRPVVAILNFGTGRVGKL